MIVNKSHHSTIENIDFDQLVFGHAFTDHMLSCDFHDGRWGDIEIGPLKMLEMHPASHVFHYGQAIFEGLKAYRTDDGGLNIFRLKDNIRRLNLSAERMAIPPVDADKVYEALLQWMTLDKDWVPGQHQGSLYIRPFIIATSPTLRAVPSRTYKFMLIASPVGFYYDHPIKVKVETKYSRAAEGGVGFAKAAGNYAAAFMPTMQAKKEGFEQLIWTDRSKHQYLEELGSANLFFVCNGDVYTPVLHDSILAGITRDSVIQLLRSQGVKVHEEKISKDEFRTKLENGNIDCLFATGTAAAITYINEVSVDQENFYLRSDENLMLRELKSSLEDYKFGRSEDSFKWNVLL